MANKKIDKAILGIIHDSLITDRTFEHIFQICNVMAPIDMDNRFRSMENINGIKNAFTLLGIPEDRNLIEELYGVFDKVCYSNESIEGKPEKIYVEWLSIINEFYSKEKEGVVKLKV